MKVWAVTNQKGGVGKTTTTVSLGGLLATQQRNTLLMDVDPHGSLTSYFGYDPDDLETGVYSLFTQQDQHPSRWVLKTEFKGLDVLPATTALATLERKMSHQGGMGLIIKSALEKLSPKYERVIIDCPPMLGMLMVNALAACDRVIIPVQTEFLALKGLERMLTTLPMIARSLRRSLPYVIVPTMFDRRTRASVQSLRVLRERYRVRLWSSVIPADTQFRDASHTGQPLTILMPQSRGSVAYAELLDYLRSLEMAP